jgi:steroid delta-isomerase-like uncharacterized protein
MLSAFMSDTTSTTISREQALAIVRLFVDAARRRDLAQLVGLYAEDAVAVSPVFGEVRGREAIEATFERMFATLTDVAVEIMDALVDGDRVAVIGTITSTDRRGWFGQPATGSIIRYRLVMIFTLANGRIIHDERIYDSAGVLDRLEKARLDKELRTAAEVQRALLARTTHAASFCESAGSSSPCRAIGGDFFEFLDLPTGDVGILMGDVAGKGPAAALLAAMLQGMFVADAPIGGGPAATLARINTRLAARQIGSRFATLVYAVLSPDGTLTYANAGHNPPALLSRGGLHRLTVGGPILGMFEQATFDQDTLQLYAGDTLVMFTDGVTEARDAGDEEFGEIRMLACLAGKASSPPAALLGDIFDAVRAFCQQADQSDDITVTVTRYR